MSMFTMATTLVTWKRITAFILEQVAVAASFTVDRQPSSAACLQVAITGTPTGTVTVAGTVGGVADTEVLTWTGSAGTRATIKVFTAFSGITTSLSGGTLIQAQAVSPSGQPQMISYTLRSGHPVELVDHSGQSWPGLPPGHERVDTATCRVQYEEVWRPRPGDLVVTGTGETWQVVGVPQVGGELSPDHWRCKLERREGL